MLTGVTTTDAGFLDEHRFSLRDLVQAFISKRDEAHGFGEPSKEYTGPLIRDPSTEQDPNIHRK